jgi:hypothetical protein
MSSINGSPSAEGLATWCYSSFPQHLYLLANGPARFQGTSAYTKALEAARSEGSVITQGFDTKIETDSILLSQQMLRSAGRLVRNFLSNPKGVYYAGTGEKVPGLTADDRYEPNGMDISTVAVYRQNTGIEIPEVPGQTQLISIGSKLPLKICMNSGCSRLMLDHTLQWQESDLGLQAAVHFANKLKGLMCVRLNANNCGSGAADGSYITGPVAIDAALRDHAQTVYL